MSQTSISICIPLITKFTTRYTIESTFKKFDLGSIDSIDIIGKENKQKAFIHFSDWNEESSRAMNVLNRLNKNEVVNIIYSFPWYWRCVKSKFCN